MKSKIILSTAAIALLALSAPAVAQTTITANLGDAIIDFRVTDGTGQGATTNLEVDLGSMSQFYDVSSSFTLAGLTNADLSAAYGSNWDTRSDLVWSVIATTGSAAGLTLGSNVIPASTIWATNAQSVLGVQSTPWNTKSTGAQNSAITLISPIYATGSGGGGLNGQTSTSNSATAALLNSTIAGSYSKQAGSNGNFSFFTSGGSLENGVNATLAGSDFYQLEPSTNLSPAVYLGTFALSGNGQLSFDTTAATVPEPSTYAAILGAVALGFVALRRRRSKAVAQ